MTHTARHLVTAALPYSNGRLHAGHIAGAYLPADIYVRYRKSCGDDVRFVCGSDDHGVAAVLSAAKEGRSVRELTASYREQQRADFDSLAIEFDVYGGTSQPEFYDTHRDLSQAFFLKLLEKSFIVKRESQQLFDPIANQFLPDRYVRGTCYHRLPSGEACGDDRAYGDQCEACGNAIDPLKLVDPISELTQETPVAKATTHWFLRLDRFEDKLRAWLEPKKATAAGSGWRESTLNFALAQLRQGLPERAITRDLDWGVPVPVDDPDAIGKALYVWFDAPIAYVSFVAELCRVVDGDIEQYTQWWKSPNTRISHFIGEDNTLFHTIIWPAMLMGEGSFRLPDEIVVNSFLNLRTGGGEEKMSKSRSTGLFVRELVEAYGADAVRYYLTAIAPENSRAAFSSEDLVSRNNTELLGALGNFIHRTLVFTHKYCDGRVPSRPPEDKHGDQRTMVSNAVKSISGAISEFRFKRGLSQLLLLAKEANRFFDAEQPWKTRLEDPSSCEATIFTCLGIVRTLAMAMYPFLPDSASRCWMQLRLESSILRWPNGFQEFPPDHVIGTPEPLFRKLEL